MATTDTLPAGRRDQFTDSLGTEDALRCASFDLSREYEVANAEVPVKPPDSGDFHAAFPLEDGSVAVVMGDVVGHGAQAAAHAGILCRAIGECLMEGLPPGEALGFVNAAAEMSPEFEGFATVFAGKVAAGTGELVYASGGHEPALVAGESNTDAPRAGKPAPVRELENTGPPLGVIGADEVRYGERTVTIENGSTLLLYTDGISEARRGRELMGTARLQTLFARWRRLRPLPLVCKILGFARAFTGQGRQLRDDAALLVLRRRRWPRPQH